MSLKVPFWTRTISSGPPLTHHSRFSARSRSGALYSLPNSAAPTLLCCLGRSTRGASRLKMPSISSSFSTSTPRFVWSACASASFNASARRIQHSLIGQHSTMKDHQKAEALRSSGPGCLLEAVRFSTLRGTSPLSSALHVSKCGWGIDGCNAIGHSDVPGRRTGVELVQVRSHREASRFQEDGSLFRSQRGQASSIDQEQRYPSTQCEYVRERHQRQ